MNSRSPAKKARSKPNRNGNPRLQVGGTLIPGKHLYIERPADRELFDLLREGEYCNILTSRQMGKSSLMAQTYTRLNDAGCHAVIADMGLIGSLVSSDRWYQGLLNAAVRQLRLSVDMEAWWRAAREATPELRLLRFFREEVAAKVPGDKPIVLFVDEIDGTLDLPFSDDFFLAMRAMYNQRAIAPEYRRIVFCPVGVASPNELIKDKRKTPYNIGKTIELRDFDAAHDDLSPLSRYVGGDETLNEILRFTGGHPYLTALIAEKFVAEGARAPEEVADLIQAAFGSLDEALRDPHFSYIQGFLAQRAEDPLVTLKLYREILRGEEVKDQVAPAHIALKLAGIVKRGPKGLLVVRNEIYRRLFTDEWAVRTAESETTQIRETTALLTAAEIYEEHLRQTDDYRTAMSAYLSLRNNPAYEKRKASELWAEFFDRRAARAEQAGERDEMILWRLRAIEASGNETRARAAQLLITSDYQRLEFSFRHPRMMGQGIRESFSGETPRIVAFSPDGKKIVTAGLDGTARLWSAETGAPIGEPMRHENGVGAVAFSPDGRRVLTGSYDETARLWSAETGAPIGEPMRHSDWVLAVAFSPDGRRVLTSSPDTTARLWSAETGAPIAEPMRHEDSVLAVAFSPDGRCVLTGSSDKTARLWNAETGASIGEPMRHEGSVLAVAFSPDGRRILTGSSDKTAWVWSAETGAPIGEAVRHDGKVRAVAFGPDGRRVLTGSSDKTARLWNAETGAPIGKPMRHKGRVRAVAFSLDGRRVLTGSDDKTARVWNAETGAPIGEPMRNSDWVRAVAFSPDGRRLLTWSDDNTARLWCVETVSDADPIAGDHKQLMTEWQRRLGLKINEAGEIVPLWP
jgi:hypothetical protein